MKEMHSQPGTQPGTQSRSEAASEPQSTQERPRRPRRTVIIAAAVLALIVGGYFVAARMFGGDVLAGPSAHRFGVVLVDEGHPEVVTADITFVNRSGSTRVLERIRSSCNCLKVSAPLGPIEPGESLTVHVELHVDAPIPTGATVTMAFDNIRVQKFTVDAIGWRRQTVSVTPNTVAIDEDGIATVYVTAQRYDEEMPPDVTWTSSALEITDATFLGWENVHERDLRRGTPAVWRGQLDVIAWPAAGQVLPIEVFVGPNHSAHASIIHWAARPSEPGRRLLPLDALRKSDEEEETDR